MCTWEAESDGLGGWVPAAHVEDRDWIPSSWTFGEWPTGCEHILSLSEKNYLIHLTHWASWLNLAYLKYAEHKH